MEISEQVYEGGTTYKITTRKDDKRSSHVRKLKGGEASSPTDLEKGCAGNRMKNNSGHPIDCTTGEKTCLVHGPRKSMSECKVPNGYSKNHAMQRPHKETRSSGNKKRGKSVNVDGKKRS